MGLQMDWWGKWADKMWNRPILFLLLVAVMLPWAFCHAQATQPTTSSMVDHKVKEQLSRMVNPGSMQEYLAAMAELFQIKQEHQELSDRYLIGLLLQFTSDLNLDREKKYWASILLTHHIKCFFRIPDETMVQALAPQLDARNEQKREMAWELLEGTGAFLLCAKSYSQNSQPLKFHAIEPYLKDQVRSDGPAPPYKLVTYMYIMHSNAALMTMAESYLYDRGERRELQGAARTVDNLVWQLYETQGPEEERVKQQLLEKIEELSRNRHFFVRLYAIGIMFNARVPLGSSIRSPEILARLAKDENKYVSRFAREKLKFMEDMEAER